MQETQTIIAGDGAQAVEVYAYDALGRVVKPTSATAGIVNLDFTESDADADRIVLAAGTAATVDSLSTTTTAAAGPLTSDPRKVVITAGVPVVGRHYVITSAGNTESFECARVDSLNIYARHELRHAHASGATVTGCRVTIDFPEATADDADELERRSLFGVDWTFVGITGRANVRTFARIERRHRAPRATISDMTRFDPLLAAAAHDTARLESHLEQAGMDVDAYMMHRGTQLANTGDGEIGRLAVTCRAVELAYRIRGEEYVPRAEWAAGEYARWLKMLLSGHKADDQVETSRPKDRVVPRRRAALPGVIVGAS